MAATVERQSRTQKGTGHIQEKFDRRLRRGNAKIKVGDHVWLEVQDGKGKEMLIEHIKGPFPVL